MFFKNHSYPQYCKLKENKAMPFHAKEHYLTKILSNQQKSPSLSNMNTRGENGGKKLSLNKEAEDRKSDVKILEQKIQ